MPVTERAILEDRWECAIAERELGDEWSKLGNRVDELVRDLYEAVAREEWVGDDYATSEHPVGDGSGGVTSDMHAAIKATLLDGIEKAQATSAKFPKPLAVAS